MRYFIRAVLGNQYTILSRLFDDCSFSLINILQISLIYQHITNINVDLPLCLKWLSRIL